MARAPRDTPVYTVPLFKDLGKNANDLLTKDFPSTLRFELNTTSENGLKFQTVVEQKKGKSGSDGVAPNVMFGSFQTKLDVKDYGIALTGTLDTELLRWEVVLSKLVQPGIKATFKGSTSTETIKEVYGDVEYKGKYGNVVLDFNLRDDVPKLELASVVGQKGYSLGAKGSYVLPDDPKKSGRLDAVSVTGGYTSNSFDFTGTFNGKFDKGGFKPTVGSTLHYKHNASTNFATSATWDPSKDLKDGVTVTVGGQHNFDSQTSVKGKVGTNGAVAVSYKQKLNKNVNLTLATEVNAITTKPHTLGFHLSFTP